MRFLVIILVAGLAAYWVGHAWGDSIAGGFRRIWESMVARGAGSKEQTTEITYYTCGMHPWVILPRPGKCPICHMELTPLDPSKFTGEIKIDPRIVQNIGVRVGQVVKGPLVKTIRTVGSVDYDERRVRDVNIKVRGWIEKLHVDYLGAEVEKGEPLFELYSPELYDTQQQYLLAFRNRDQPDVPFLTGAEKDPMHLLESSRIRLEYYDITPKQIADLEREGKPQKTMTIVSPYKGVVISKHANEGMLVDPGMLVFRIADLSRVWVLVTLYEYQLPYVSTDQRGVMTLPYIPGQTFEGKVVYVYPFLEKKTREVQVRLEFQNPDLLLKPGMFANVELKSTLAEDRTLAPRAAVIDTGEREVAFVSLGEGKFEPRQVRTGILTENGMVEILDGLRPGELVVTSAQFLLDSEAKIREALAKMIRGNLASEQEAAGTVAGTSELTSLPDDVSAALRTMLEDYFAIGEKLAGDMASGIRDPARGIATAIDTLLKTTIPEDPHFWHKHTEAATVRGKALELAGDGSIENVRLRYADLSVALAKLLKATGIPPSYTERVEELHCPMYREGQGGSTWLQNEGEVRNPFFGSTMLQCFDSRTVLPVTGVHESVEATDNVGSGKETEAGPAAEAPRRSDVEQGGEQKEVEQTPEVERKSEVEKPATGEAPGTRPAAAPQTGEGARTASSPKVADEALGRIIDEYLAIGDRLASDSITGIAEPARGVAKSVDTLLKTTLSGDPDFWNEHPEVAVARGKALELVSAKDLKAARLSYADLSVALGKLLRAAGVPPSYGEELEELHCPMYRAGQGGSIWVQPKGEVRNPFFGSAMLRCFDKRTALPKRVEETRGPGTGPTSSEERGGHSTREQGSRGK